MDENTIAYIDGDILLHTVLRRVRSQYRKEYNLELSEIEDYKNLDPTLHKAIMDDITEYIHETVENWTANSWCTRNKVVIGGPTNFRKKLFPSYKASKGRLKDKETRGDLYKFTKERVIEITKPTVSRNCEADDVQAIWNTKNPNSVIVSLDKDMLQLSAYHLDVMNDRYFFQKPNDAYYAFCKQMLMGDTVDNITGIWRVGEAKSSKILKASKGDYKEAVKEVYRNTHKDRWEKEFELMGKLLWLQREPGQKFTLDLFDEYYKNY